MSKVSVISKDSILEGEKVRYINYNNTNYFIYTLNEQDNDGYEKLYINKIVSNQENYIDDDEWNDLKKAIPPIVKEIKADNITSFKDLDIEKIDKIDISYAHTFKLKIDIVKMITKKTDMERINILDKELENLINNENNEDDNNTLSKLDDFLKNPIDYSDENNEEIAIPKQPIENDQNEIDELKKKVEQLEEEIKEYQDKLDKIKAMIES